VRLAERAAGPAFFAKADRLLAHGAGAGIQPRLLMVIVAVGREAADAEVRLKLGILFDLDRHKGQGHARGALFDDDPRGAVRPAGFDEVAAFGSIFDVAHINLHQLMIRRIVKKLHYVNSPDKEKGPEGPLFYAAAFGLRFQCSSAFCLASSSPCSMTKLTSDPLKNRFLLVLSVSPSQSIW